ncbi:DUF2730 family protein [Pectobacterium aroidearum]|uniref:DUF2730 family protein n=1 Tax=Pectobacterium aroidearum TaxID=1201031 RepID=UPI002115B93D|nr:DUF2730 family protein [Pectobacterium aroidearum]UUE71107.1 DUF2730 family protein [Pectobacterium aroidearum]UUE71505.1 DUF2730 family protein [Pectobacterium aroidearum]UUE71573.1 DUF2730 family protein [Pectobacterium aroidearum]UUE75505.1 DUF2730 family protein [Pectobacterium aroidearum]UUE75906.1 DUF2730 family protein [Pectobacterium aroidearum]
MGINELSFNWQFLQWIVMAVVGVYTWLIGRQSASQQELLELRTRITTLEAQVKQVPTQAQVTELISNLSRTEAGLNGLMSQVTAISRRTETINDYLLQKNK